MATLSLHGRLPMAALALVVAATVGCGGTDGPEPGEPVEQITDALPLNPCRSDLVARGYEFTSPSGFPGDFETGRNAGFWLSRDPSDGIVWTSEPDTLIQTNDEGGRVHPTAIDGRSCVHDDGTEGAEGSFALHIGARGLSGWGFSLTQNYSAGDDASSWDGISFWIRRDPGEVGRTVLASALDWHTTEAPWNPDDPETPEPPDDFFCGDIPSRPDLKCDKFGAGIGLDEDWRFVAIPFASMRQNGYGVPAPCLYVRGIKGVGLSAESGDWDVWIDDIAFYRAPEGQRPPAVECDDAPP